MGLFDRRDEKKKSDAFDSPVETIDLNAPPEDPQPAASRPEAAPAAVEDGDSYAADYGIEQAIQLMRTLPQDNVELVVQVVKSTLESTQIKIARIIDDATTKQQDVEGRIKVLKNEIADLENEIASRKSEIGTLEADYEETSRVKDRLVLAEKLGKGDADKRVGAQARGKPAGESARPKRSTESPAAGGEGRPKRATEPPAQPSVTAKPAETAKK